MRNTITNIFGYIFAGLLALAMVAIPVLVILFLFFIVPTVWGLIMMLLFWLAPESMNAFRTMIGMSNFSPFTIGFAVGVIVMIVRAMFGSTHVRVE